MARLITPITPPRARLPVSPIMISAGWLLNQRKPTEPPTSARLYTASSQLFLTKGICRYAA